MLPRKILKVRVSEIAGIASNLSNHQKFLVAVPEMKLCFLLSLPIDIGDLKYVTAVCGLPFQQFATTEMHNGRWLASSSAL